MYCLKTLFFCVKYKLYHIHLYVQFKYKNYQNNSVNLIICNYYIFLALNGDNITADRYIYVASNGIVEGLAYLTTIPLLLYIGRKKAVSGLFFSSGILQISLLAISKGKL